MSSMNFGQDILPKVNNAYQIGSNSYKWKVYASNFYADNLIVNNSLDIIRKENTTIGTNSCALGYMVEASNEDCIAAGYMTKATGLDSIALGYMTEASGQASLALGDTTEASGSTSIAVGENTTASGTSSLATGYETIASGTLSHTEGNATEASGVASHAEGVFTIAAGGAQHVFGLANVADSYNSWPEWVANTSYSVGQKVKVTTNNVAVGYVCKYANSDSTFTSTNWTTNNGQMNYIEIVGNGKDSEVRSNARVLDWDGNERIKGDLYVGCNADSTGGTKVATIAQLPSIMTGATSSDAGTSGLVPAPTTADVDKFLAGDGTYKSGGLPMVILSYGNSTWSDFISAYNNNVIVYCRASSNSNPATGAQGRMAFMAYLNNATDPTEVEFQYYRSMNAHSATAMGDQVFVYKLNKTKGWSVISRDASIKEIKMATGSAGSVSWSSNVVTLNSGLPAVTASDNGKILKVVNGAWALADP